MPDPVQPTIIQGPAIVTYDSQTYHVKGDISVQYAAESFSVESAEFGNIDTRLQSRRFTISFRPTGQLPATNLDKYTVYAPADVGTSIFSVPAANDLVIQTKAGRQFTFHRAGLTRPPTMILKPTDTIFGDMEFQAIGDPTIDPSNAAAITTEQANAFSDATFDETEIETNAYTAAWGVAAPYNAMGAVDGFEVELVPTIQDIVMADIGIADMILMSLEARVRFAPNNLTQAEIETKLLHQGASVVQVGQSFKSSDDLVITGGTVSITLHRAGLKDGGYLFGPAQHQHQVFEFVNNTSFTLGVPQAILTTAVS